MCLNYTYVKRKCTLNYANIILNPFSFRPHKKLLLEKRTLIMNTLHVPTSPESRDRSLKANSSATTIHYMFICFTTSILNAFMHALLRCWRKFDVDEIDGQLQIRHHS